SIHAEDARAQLEVMKRTVPEADTVAMARMKYEMENHTKVGLPGQFWGLFRSRPDLSQAAKSGTPPMEGYRPTIPPSVPPSADSEIEKVKQVPANPAAPKAARAAAPAATPAASATTPVAENTAKPAAD